MCTRLNMLSTYATAPFRELFMRKFLLAVAFAGMSAGGPAAAQTAADFNGQTIGINIGFVPGGPADIYARAVAQRLSEPLGQQVIVEDRPGAGSVVGTDAVAKSPSPGTRPTIGSQPKRTRVPGTR